MEASRSITIMVKIKHLTPPSSQIRLGQPAGTRTGGPQVQVTYISMEDGSCGVHDVTDVFRLELRLRKGVWVCQQFSSLEPSSAFIKVVIASLLTFMCHLIRKMMKWLRFLPIWLLLSSGPATAATASPCASCCIAAQRATGNLLPVIFDGFCEAGAHF